MSQSSWLVAGMLPGIERQPRKKLEPSPERLLGLLHRWRDEAVRAALSPIAASKSAIAPARSLPSAFSFPRFCSAPARSLRKR